MSAEEVPVTTHTHPVRPVREGGRSLTLIGPTPDGARLVLADESGAHYQVAVDARLRAVLGGPTRTPPPEPSSAKVETQMESMLRPRDIQARIRSGETAESVAAAARTTVEKVMPFAAPVLAEREHTALRAQRSSVRRPAGEPSTAPRTLADAVTGHLHSLNVDPETVVWDSWRREDGRWALTARYAAPTREGLAELTFDPPGNFVVLDNDDARWLVGDLPDPVTEPEPSAVEPAPRRLAAVRDDQPTLDDELLGLAPPDQPLEAFLDDRPGPDESDRAAQAADVAALDEPAPEPPPRRTVKKSRGRASVPSWDEIMFGGPPD